MKEIAGVDELPVINISPVRIRFAPKTSFGLRILFMPKTDVSGTFSGRNRTVENLRELVAAEKRSLGAER